MKKLFVLILLTLIPLFVTKEIQALTYSLSYSAAEQYCIKNPKSRLNCDQLACERRNTSKEFNSVYQDGFIGDNTSNRTTYEDCSILGYGIKIPSSLSSGLIAEIVFTVLSRFPQLEVFTPLRFIGLIAAFFNKNIVQLILLYLIFRLFPFNVLFLLFFIILIIVRFLRKRMK